MAVSLARRISLALILSLITTAHAHPCANPRVRREWRSISETEREEWVAAVKVGVQGFGVIYFAIADPTAVPQQGVPQINFETRRRRVRHPNPIRQSQ